MHTLTAIILISIFLLIFTAILIFSYTIHTENQYFVQSDPNLQIKAMRWSKNTPYPGPKGTCQVYTFENSTQGTLYQSGQPTLSLNILDKMDGVTNPLPNCLYPNQIYAQKVIRTCLAPDVPTSNDLNPSCITMNNQIVKVGYQETYYTSDCAPQLLQCLGVQTLLSVNYQIGNPDITTDNTYAVMRNNNTAEMGILNPLNPDQVLNVIRVNLGQSPAALKPGNSQSGPIVSIWNVVSESESINLFLIKTNNRGIVTINPKYGNNCVTEGVTVTGNIVGFGSPVVIEGLPYGYNWAVIPAMVIKRDGKDFMIAPQITWLGEIENIDKIPSKYNGNTGFAAFVAWLYDSDKGMSMIWTGTEGDDVVLIDMLGYEMGDGSDDEIDSVQQCQIWPYVCQFVNLSLYNYLVGIPVCIGSGSNKMCSNA